jgi:hypothetical protein
LATKAAALSLGESTPDPELLPIVEGILEAVSLYLAASAYGLCLASTRSPLWEEEVRVNAEAVGSLLPATI